jgi:hypothetical protein
MQGQFQGTGMNNGMSQSYGTLSVRPAYAQLTHDTDFFSKMSPFLVLVNGSQRVKSSVSHGGGKNPKWNDNLTINASSQDRVLIEVFDHHTFTTNEVVAVGEIFISKIVSSGGNLQEYVPLYYKGKQAGTIMIQATFMGQQSGMNQMGMNMGGTQMGMNMGGTQMGMNMGGTQMGMTMGGTQMGMNVGMQPTYVQPQQTFVQTMPQQTMIQSNGFGYPTTYIQPQPTIIQQQPTIIGGGFMQPTVQFGGGFGGGFGGQKVIVEEIIIEKPNHHHHHGHHHGHHHFF